MPVPLLPAVTLAQLASLFVVHPQPEAVVTPIWPASPDAPTVSVEGLTPNVQRPVPACAAMTGLVANRLKPLLAKSRSSYEPAVVGNVKVSVASASVSLGDVVVLLRYCHDR